MKDNKLSKDKINLIVSAIIFILAIVIFFNVIVARSTETIPRVFGYSFHLVVTDSMTPEIKVGDFVVAKKVAKQDVNIGDVIVFISPDPSLNGKIIIHKVVGIVLDDSGNKSSFITQGVKEGASVDSYPVENVEGRYVAKSTFVGGVFSFFSKIENWIFLTVIIILLCLTVKLIKHIVKLAKIEKSQTK